MNKLEKDIKALAETDDGAALRATCTALARFNRRRDRLENPEGFFDNGGRWYPSGDDVGCCGCNREPSRAWPYTWLQECRTQLACLMHDGALGGDVSNLRKWLRHLGVDPRKEYSQSTIQRRVRGSLRASRFKIAA